MKPRVQETKARRQQRNVSHRFFVRESFPIRHLKIMFHRAYITFKAIKANSCQLFKLEKSQLFGDQFSSPQNFTFITSEWIQVSFKNKFSKKLQGICTNFFDFFKDQLHTTIQCVESYVPRHVVFLQQHLGKNLCLKATLFAVSMV